MLTPGRLAPETDTGSGNQAPLSPCSFQGWHPYQLNSTPGKLHLRGCAELPRVMGRGLQCQGGLGWGAENPPFSAVLGRFLGEMLFLMKPGKNTGVELGSPLCAHTHPPPILGHHLKHRASSSSQMSKRGL